MTAPIIWHCKAFAALSGVEIYRILRARQQVFVLEQACLYLDLDDLDQQAWHLFAEREGDVLKQPQAVAQEVLKQPQAVAQEQLLKQPQAVAQEVLKQPQAVAQEQQVLKQPQAVAPQQLLAYCRLLAPGASYEQASIGRVLTTPAARKLGLGRELMSRAIAHTRSQFPNSAIKIGAQHYLQAFYQSLGFVRVSDLYDEDGIPHIEMELP